MVNVARMRKIHFSEFISQISRIVNLEDGILNSKEIQRLRERERESSLVLLEDINYYRNSNRAQVSVGNLRAIVCPRAIFRVGNLVNFDLTKSKFEIYHHP